MTNINIDRLIDTFLEKMEEEKEYHYSSRKYFRKYGHGVRIDRPETDEERHIAHYAHLVTGNDYAISAILEILNMDIDMQTRLYSAVRAARKWYEKTQYQYCLDSGTLEKLEKYIFG